ncbi:MAG: hypothetical protein ACSHWW_14185 [Nonlabens sp.]|uniref:hypothetical protein n=1 Tax=Nonlabens sp. TaxID=1888209 RepID=UPI003EF1EA6F
MEYGVVSSSDKDPLISPITLSTKIPPARTLLYASQYAFLRIVNSIKLPTVRLVGPKVKIGWFGVPPFSVMVRELVPPVFIMEPTSYCIPSAKSIVIVAPVVEASITFIFTFSKVASLHTVAFSGASGNVIKKDWE